MLCSISLPLRVLPLTKEGEGSNLFCNENHSQVRRCALKPLCDAANNFITNNIITNKVISYLKDCFTKCKSVKKRDKRPHYYKKKTL